MVSDPAINDLIEGIRILGEFVKGIFQNEMALFFVLLTILTIMIWNLVRILLSRVPVFKGSEQNTVNSQGNIVAWCISLLSVISIGWGFIKEPGSSVDAFISAITGPWGVLIIFATCAFLAWSIYSGMQNSDNITRLLFSLTIAGGLYFYLMYNMGRTSSAFLILITGLFILIPLGLYLNIKGN
ncbi:MAG: hypothetical protein ACMXYG_01940 [Candidatus Woesearchaeota archaeon]